MSHFPGFLSEFLTVCVC